MRRLRVLRLLPVVIALALLLLVRSAVTTAQPLAGTVHCVNQTGSDCSAACGGCYSVIQTAVDAATSGDEVRIGAGSYSATGTVISVTKALAISGGWDPSCGELDPEVHPVVLDAGQGGAVVYARDAGDVVLEHVTLTRGNGTGQCPPHSCGGGVYARGTAVHLLWTTVAANAGHVEATTNFTPASSVGGGIYVVDGALDLRFSRVLDNVGGDGGDYSYGGGVFVTDGTAELIGNDIARNLGSPNYAGSGGVHLNNLSSARVLGNAIHDNEANRSTYWSTGGGLALYDCADVLIADNKIAGNAAGLRSGIGGGIAVRESEAHLTRNVIAENTGGMDASQGSGIAIRSTRPVTLTNNLIAHNHGNASSAGVYMAAPAGQARFYNNTIVGNGGHGVYVSENAEVTLVNTLIADHAVGISQPAPLSSTVAADHTLLWNESDPVVGSAPVIAEPRLTGGFALRADSPARNAGIDVPWLMDDLEGNPRPQEGIWDIGALEGVRWDAALPLTVKESGPGGLWLQDGFDRAPLVGWTPNRGLWLNNVGENLLGYYALGNAWAIHDLTAGDLAYEATVSLIDGNAVGLTFRSTPDGTASYDVILDAVDGAFKLSTRPPYQVLDSHAMTVDRHRRYRIRVEAQGDTLFGFLDGAHLLTATDTAYADGHVGVIVFRALATVDDVEVWPLP